MTREELRSELWSADVFVDFEHGINSAIKRLRDCLCDSAAEPRYVETVGRRGYRWIATVTNVIPADPPRREAKGRPSFPTVEAPKPDRVCRGCGKQIPRHNRFCPDCALTVIREGFDVGRKAAQRPDSLAKRSATQRMHKQAIRNWKSSDLPDWLTREVYVERVQPELVQVAKSRIRLALGVSEPYASDIQAGKRVPHPRHWQALAQLVGGFGPSFRQRVALGASRSARGEHEG